MRLHLSLTFIERHLHPPPPAASSTHLTTKICWKRVVPTLQLISGITVGSFDDFLFWSRWACSHFCIWTLLLSSSSLLSSRLQGVLHTVSGYMLYTATTFKVVFDHQPDDVYWCTADIGWITGHSYITYGPLANGATSVLVSVRARSDFLFTGVGWRVM